MANLTAGIVGLPNVGKSTLFNALTEMQVEAANYPFATINPNEGTVIVGDDRIDKLANLINPEKITYATFTFVDIAGLVKGASKGEGLGNKFLENIREVDAICHVVRCFSNSEIIHVQNEVNPLADIEIINTELILSDLETISKRLVRIEGKKKSGNKEAEVEVNFLAKLTSNLDKLIMLNTLKFNEIEQGFLKQLNLITAKPFIMVANIDETDVANANNNAHFLKVKQYAQENNYQCVAISSKIEYEISTLQLEERKQFMQEMGIARSGIQVMSRAAYDLLGLMTYFTFGKKEVRAWTFIKGWKAPQCAGVIHSDFEKGFIKAEVIKWSDLVECKNELNAKALGKMRLEGKEYLMQDGDVCNFKFNV